MSNMTGYWNTYAEVKEVSQVNTQMSENNQMSNNKRIDWIDMAKGYGIFLVIYAHLGVGAIGRWIYTFHIPLFFFLSGYVFSTKYDFKTFAMRKFRSMILPYFALGIPMVLFQCLDEFVMGRFHEGTGVELLVNFLVQKRFWTLWYIACLFWLNIIFYWIVTGLKKMQYILIVSMLMFCVGVAYYECGGTPWPWNVDVCLTAVVFFAVGYWFKNRYDRIRKCIDLRKSVGLFLVLGTVNVLCGFASYRLAGIGLDMYASSYGFPPLTFVSAFAGIFCVVIVAHWFTLSGIRYVGRNSLLFYAWHQTILIPVIDAVFAYLGVLKAGMPVWVNLGVRFLEMIVIVAILAVCNVIISHSKLKVMLGK